jgi:alpha-L-fucosidase 2
MNLPSLARFACLTVFLAIPGFAVAGTAADRPETSPPATPGGELKLWYREPAQQWTQGLPLGNGRLAAMVFGGVEEEHLQLNEDTLTSDEPGYRTLPLDVRKDFAQITGLIAQRQFKEADQLVSEKWLGRAWACYQPLGDLWLNFPAGGKVEDYRRELDLANAVCRVRYRQGDVTFTRELFASHPDEAIIIRLTVDKPANLTFRIRLNSVHPTASTSASAEHARLAMSGQLPGLVLRRTLEWVEKQHDTWKYPELWDSKGKRMPHAKPVLYGQEINGKGAFFDAQLRLRTRGGKLAAEKDVLSVTGADEAVLILTAASSYNGFDKSPSREGVDAAKRAEEFLQSASQKPYAELLSRHTGDYCGLMERVALNLGNPTAQSKLPTDQRIKQFALGSDPALAVLYFQFGRYLMICGSRPGTQPLNLQGKWNAEVIPPWASGYTININTEMNYWPVEVCNLSECHEPLLRMIRELAVDGHRVAHDMYGRRGWVAHHNTTLWRDAQPVDNTARCAYWPMGSGWLCQHLYEHYRFTGDRKFLEQDAYPLMKDACLFYLDWLVDDGKGRLVTPVGISPENTFRYTDRQGQSQRAGVSAGSTMDMAIIRELFTDTAQAAELLHTDAEFSALLRDRLKKLLPYQIGTQGQLLEWQEGLAESDPHHRHVSHLFGLYPGEQISVQGTPELAAAARRSLELRGDGGTGWSKAWKISFWARLEDGDHAYKMLTELLAKSTSPDLLDVCPPFQIDGNFGGTAGIAEMLLQSHERDKETGDVLIHLLPALPAAWPTGSVKGLRARGGFEVDLQWTSGRLTAVTIRSTVGTTAKLQYAQQTVPLRLKPGESLRLDGKLK